ncbi:MAG: GIY-YIG nuclease family protein [Desulfotalea sp.]
MSSDKQIKVGATWYVYMVECADKTIYTGITTNLERRVHEHNHTKLGAKYTRSRRPVSLKYHEIHHSKSQASSREYAIKKLARENKKKLIATNHNLIQFSNKGE